MGQLFFKKPLQIAILEGRKTTTLRRWDKPRVRAGHRAYALGVGWLDILSVEPFTLDLLTDADAVADGFASRDTLVAALADLYPHADADGKGWYLVRFRLDELEPPRAAVRPARTAAAASRT